MLDSAAIDREGQDEVGHDDVANSLDRDDDHDPERPIRGREGRAGEGLVEPLLRRGEIALPDGAERTIGFAEAADARFPGMA